MKRTRGTAWELKRDSRVSPCVASAGNVHDGQLALCTALQGSPVTLEAPRVPTFGLQIMLLSRQICKYGIMVMRIGSICRCTVLSVLVPQLLDVFCVLRTSGRSDGETPGTPRAPAAVWHGGSDFRYDSYILRRGTQCSPPPHSQGQSWHPALE